jgi:isochorismate synthase EntC
MLKCKKCKLEKYLIDFEMKSEGQYYASCNICREKRKQALKNNDDTYSKKYYKKNKDKIRERNRDKRPYSEYKEYFSKYKKNYYQNNKEQIKNKVKKYRSQNLEKILLNNARRRALKNNIQFSINIEDIIIPAMCPILNIPIILDSNLKSRDNSPSIDRLVPELGYTKENIRIILMIL